MGPIPDRRTLGAIGFDSELLDYCARELEALADLEPVPTDIEQLLGLERFDALLIALRARPETVRLTTFPQRA